MHRILASILLVLSLSLPVSATTYLVRPDGTGDFPTIQVAVAMAADGDIIELTDGTFTGEGNRDIDFLGKRLTVKSQSGNEALCTIDCQGAATTPRRAFHFHSGETSQSILQGICIRNGYAEWDSTGAAILCAQGSSPFIDGCWFDENFAESGGGCLVCQGEAFPTIVGCRFTGNVTNWGHGASILLDSASATIEHCDFVENAANGGAAGIACYDGSVLISGCSFVGNLANRGAALYGSLAHVTMERCVFAYNTAGGDFAVRGGAIHVSSGTFTLTDCTLYRNEAEEGGALFITEVNDATITSCTFTNNAAPLGGGIYLFSSGTSVAMDNTIVAFSETGEAVHCANAVATLGCCDLYGNADGDWVGTIADQYGVDGNIAEDPLFCDPESHDL